jgi:hypothetical protein
MASSALRAQDTTAALTGDQATTPEQQPPAQQTPPADQAPQPSQQPGQAGRQNLKLPPPPPKIIDVRMPGEAGVSIGFTGWAPFGNNYLDKGHSASFSGPSFAQLAGSSHGSFGAEVGVAAGLHNTIKASYFFAKTSGSLTAPTDLVLFSQTYSAGEALSNSSKLSVVKLSYEYLTWPYPVERRHFRLKTLYQVQYVTMRTAFDDPVKSATPDSTGTITSYATLGSKSFFSPAFGLGIHEYAARNLHFEVDVTGFAWPHRIQLLDTEASVGYRIGVFDIRAGAQAFHFRTSPQNDYFFRGTLAGAFVGIRWHSD